MTVTLLYTLIRAFSRKTLCRDPATSHLSSSLVSNAARNPCFDQREKSAERSEVQPKNPVSIQAPSLRSGQASRFLGMTIRNDTL